MVKPAKERRHPARQGMAIRPEALAVAPELAIVNRLDFEERQFLVYYLSMGNLQKALEKAGRDITWYEMKRDNYPDFREAIETLGHKAKKSGEDMMAVMVPWSVGELRGLIEQSENLGVKMAAIKYLHEATGVGAQYRQGMPGTGQFLQVNVKVATGEKESKVIELGRQDA